MPDGINLLAHLEGGGVAERGVGERGIAGVGRGETEDGEIGVGVFTDELGAQFAVTRAGNRSRD